ncbi:aldehyde dehydrogenase [bacterium]|nr:aldehyde dehydrogenase [bacterium]
MIDVTGGSKACFEASNYINRKFLKSEGEFFDNINPSTKESVGKFPQSTPTEVSLAYTGARIAFEKWRKLSRVKRGDHFFKVAQIIERRREELAVIISAETGKSYNESIAEVNEALHMAQYAFGSGRNPIGEVIASEISEKDSYMLRKPKGVIAIVSPFNFPVAIGAFWCAAPALVEGNTVILKPSEDAPMSSHMCAEIYHEAGFPRGVFNVVYGDGDVGNLLVREEVDHICFTGSAEVGQHVRKVAAESWHKTTSCEMGSKSAVIILDDADLDLAIPACIASAFKLSGQRCVSAGRMIVHREIFDEFVERFSKAVGEVTFGSPLRNYDLFVDPLNRVSIRNFKVNEGVYYGPLINQQALDKVLKYNKMVFEDPEVSVLFKGEPTDVLEDKGYFISPTIYTSEWRDVPFLKEEVFGPHVAIIPVDDTEQAIEVYNDTEYGLALGVITEDFKKARLCRNECDAGMIYWNGGSIAAESHLAFGGVKKSGNGFPSAARTFRAVTHEISWTVNHADSLEFPQGMK